MTDNEQEQLTDFAVYLIELEWAGADVQVEF